MIKEQLTHIKIKKTGFQINSKSGGNLNPNNNNKNHFKHKK